MATTRTARPETAGHGATRDPAGIIELTSQTMEATARVMEEARLSAKASWDRQADCAATLARTAGRAGLDAVEVMIGGVEAGVRVWEEYAGAAMSLTRRGLETLRPGSRQEQCR